MNFDWTAMPSSPVAGSNAQIENVTAPSCRREPVAGLA
jgi:hypothetical protein